MSKALLAVVFNHRFEKNLGLLRAFYGPRFSAIRFLMPFSQIADDTVIPVHGSSYLFQGYIAQAAATLLKEDADYFVFAGDDLILNPSLDESNLAGRLDLDAETSFISELFSVTRAPIAWGRLISVLESFHGAQRHTAWQQELPPVEEAVRQFESIGLPTDGMEWNGGFEDETIMPLADEWRRRAVRRVRLRAGGLQRLVYPLAWGYSDLVVVPRGVLARFAHYCGVLSGVGVFVESGLPTALALASPRIKTEKDLDWKSTVVWHAPEHEIIKGRFGNSLRRLSEGFGERELAIHPVKLSTYTNDLP